MKIWLNDPKSIMGMIRSRKPELVSSTCADADLAADGIFTFTARWDMERCTDPVQFPGKPDWTYRHGDDDEWLYQMNRHGFLPVLAKAYGYTGDLRYKTSFIHLISDWISSCPLCPESRKTTWRSLEAGIRVRNWLLSLHLIGDSLPPGILDAMENSLRQHMQYLVDAHDTFHEISNWGVLQDEGLFLLAVYFQNDGLRKVALDRLVRNMSLAVFADGSHWEQSPMYTGEVLGAYLSVVNVACQQEIPLPPDFARRTELMAVAFSYFMKKDGMLYTHGDTDAINACDLMAFAAAVTGNPGLKAIAGDDGADLYPFFCSPAQVTAYDALEPQLQRMSVSLPDSGHFFLRGKHLDVHFSCGSLGSGHGHADLLHVDVSYEGEDVWVDSGRYTYRDIPIRWELKGALAHNTPVIGNQSFTEPTGTWSFGRVALPVKKSIRTEKDMDCASGGHLGYLVSHGIYVERKVLRLGEHVVVVVDIFHCPSSTDTTDTTDTVVTSSFHFHPDIRLNSDILLDPDTRLEQGAVFGISGRTVSGNMALIRHGSVTLENAPYSPAYNEITEGSVIRSMTHLNRSMVQAAVLSLSLTDDLRPLAVSTRPVTFARKQTELDDRLSLGMAISYGSDEYTVMVVEEDLIGEVDLYRCNGQEGYGRVQVFIGTSPHGTCLEW
ncbi:alginate lyase family protein [Parasphaerochaeta coccoides]|uniref:Heparinase II/III family protein n=1 Tax=Parasphaerochaeta coccoides (strain ATCC BAA-1237 / DSM 17374 / SPN1) TaxID=760011 RepID=F4GHK1_PARC1|nr:alginate lyase family protein [Parasphaerochaeta coccoides]AEC02590.1 Heparinase II/III family protein [Parasphaerochaeta coccoides DSM 17374]